MYSMQIGFELGREASNLTTQIKLTCADKNLSIVVPRNRTCPGDKGRPHSLREQRKWRLFGHNHLATVEVDRNWWPERLGHLLHDPIEVPDVRAQCSFKSLLASPTSGSKKRAQIVIFGNVHTLSTHLHRNYTTLLLSASHRECIPIKNGHGAPTNANLSSPRCKLVRHSQTSVATVSFRRAVLKIGRFVTC